MKLTLQATTNIVQIDGTECRVWEGQSERGSKLSAFIAMIAVDDLEEQRDLALQLIEKAAPAAFPFPPHLHTGLHDAAHGAHIDDPQLRQALRRLRALARNINDLTTARLLPEFNDAAMQASGFQSMEQLDLQTRRLVEEMSRQASKLQAPAAPAGAAHP